MRTRSGFPQKMIHILKARCLHSCIIDRFGVGPWFPIKRYFRIVRYISLPPFIFFILEFKKLSGFFLTILLHLEVIRLRARTVKAKQYYHVVPLYFEKLGLADFKYPKVCK